MKANAAGSGSPMNLGRPVSRSAPNEELLSNTDHVAPELAAALEAAGKPYYDAARDRKDVAAYYAEVDRSADGTSLYQQLGSLVRRTHTTKFGFNPLERLHPWVDLRPNLRLQSIYSPEPVAVNDPVKHTKRKDFIQKVRITVGGRVHKNGTVGPPRKKNKKIDFLTQAKQWTEILGQGPADAVTIAARIALIEGYRYYNAEHSVPQVYFDRNRVAKGDLHHLFTCERNTNSIRGCRVYDEVDETPENRLKGGWGPKALNRYEPEAGKGAVARATLYFLVRYPGKLGDRPGEYNKSDVETLLRWSREDPVSLYEKHRNQAIAELQGNRNPFIDFPELAEKVDFTAGFGAYGKTH
ncbi:MAG: endonuclease [Armatimonadetes bacterium]|nr:endonuclease [Armatimonadota bacterium]